MAIKKYMSLERLQEYDALIKQEIVDAVSDKANSSHTHDDRYYTETEIDSKLAGKSDDSHKHDNLYDAKGAAATVQTNLNTVSDTLDAHTGNAGIHVTATNKSNWGDAYTHSQSAHARTDATKVSDSSTNGNIIINGAETNVYTHPTSGVSAGTYKSVTVNAQGHVTGGTNPTTLAGYGITDAETKGAANTALASAKEYTDTVASGKSDTTHKHDDLYDAKGSADTALASAKTYADSAATKVKDDLLNGAGTAYDTLKELGDLIVDNADAIDALETIASGKADATHSHEIAEVNGLQSALDGKANSSHGTHVTWSTTAPKANGTAAVGTETKVARGDHVHPTDTTRASKEEFDAHDSDSTRHITATERTNWGAAYTHSQAAHAPSNAEKNQNAFSNVKVGSTTIAADTTTDTLTLVAGANVTITPDATNDKITIAATDTVYTHPNSGVTAGTYKSVTVNAQGHITAGSNPTTLSGYGITDAAPKTHSHAISDITNLQTTLTNASSAISANTSSIDAHTGRITELENKVGDGFAEITSAEIQALFA